VGGLKKIKKEPHMTDIASMQQALVEQLLRRKCITAPEVEAAFRSVPRHLFLPQVSPEEAYQDQAIATKVVDGQYLSSASQPAIVAIMLEQLGLRPGMRVLEIGAGTGYNAALMAHIVGSQGQVVSMDIDQDLAESAQEHLASAGYERVQIYCADGAEGYAETAPYDRIILTVSAGDIAPAWIEQLALDGRLLLPLALNGIHIQFSTVFERQQKGLVSTSAKCCGFLGLRGVLADPDTQITLRQDKEESRIFVLPSHVRELDAQQLYQTLQGPYQEQATGISANVQEIYWSLIPWLSFSEPQMARLVGTHTLRDRVPALLPAGPMSWMNSTAGLFEAEAFSVLIAAPDKADIPEKSVPLMIRAYGSNHSLAERLLKQMQSWHRQGRPTDDRLSIRAYPIHEEEHLTNLPERAMIITKKLMRFICIWK
jgi:protein-L-isoaspartate(D-aspartate) O-methyltransferase